MSVKLAIGICSNRHSSADFNDDMTALACRITNNGIRGVNLVDSKIFRKKNASELCAARHEILVQSLKMGFTDLLWIDDDSKFPSDSLDSMFSHGVSVVGVNTPRKNVEKAMGRTIYTALDMNGQPMQSYGRRGLSEASAIGMGMMLMNLEVMKNIAPPYFEILWDHNLQCHQSETRYFSKLLKANGIKMYIDQDLSNRIGHVGDNDFNYSYYAKTGVI